MEHALTLQDAVGSDPFGNVDQVAYMDNGDARPLDLLLSLHRSEWRYLTYW